jgi:hypothetical protein
MGVSSRLAASHFCQCAFACTGSIAARGDDDESDATGAIDAGDIR